MTLPSDPAKSGPIRLAMTEPDGQGEYVPVERPSQAARRACRDGG